MIAKDMTVGSPVKLLLSFTLPLTLGYMVQQLYSMADSIIVGKGIGVEAFAAVGATAWVSFLILGFVTGLTGGFSILTAQCFGAGDAKGLRHTLTQGTLLSVALSLVVTVVSMATCKPLLQLLRTPADILEDANVYLLVIYAGTLPTVMYNFYASILRALGNTKGPLYVLIASALANIGLDLLFVIPLKMGVGGAALATVLSQLLSAVLCWLMLRRYPILKTEKDDWKLYLPMQKKLIGLGIPMALQNSVISIGGIILQSVVNGFGSACVAGFSAASRVQALADQPGFTLGLAIATYAGQNLGAKKLDRIKDGVRKGVLISLIMNVITGGIIILLNRPLVLLFMDSAETDALATAHQYILVMGLFEWVLGLLFFYRSALQGMGNTLMPMASGVVELVMRIVIVLTFPTMLGMGFLGVCIAEVGAWTGAAILLAAAYYTFMAKKCREMKNAPAESSAEA